VSKESFVILYWHTIIRPVQVHSAAILENNMKFIESNLGENVLIGNKRFLLTSQNIKIQ
jgi:hypothetical protein